MVEAENLGLTPDCLDVIRSISAKAIALVVKARSKA
jgi:hypothetical protein